jgi:hypothetical protein
MCKQAISKDTSNVTFLLDSRDGHTLCNSQDFQQIGKSGQARALASHSAAPANNTVQTTLGICGLNGSVSLESASLSLFLASKLQALLAMVGSTLFSMTWKAKATPAGRRYFQLVASRRRTSGKECGSWRSPAGQNGEHGSQDVDKRKAGNHAVNLQDQVTLAAWPTPNAMEGGQTSRGGDRKDELLMGGLVQAAAWQSPTSTTMGKRKDNEKRRKYRESTGRQSLAPGNLEEQAMIYATTGPTSNGCLAETEKPGQLNPAFSLWLMGFPAEWLSCAP